MIPYDVFYVIKEKKLTDSFEAVESFNEKAGHEKSKEIEDQLMSVADMNSSQLGQ